MLINIAFNVFLLVSHIFICSFQQENLALNKYTVQSSTYASYYSRRANDGDPNTCSIASVSPEAFGVQAYWQVDLGNVYDVDQVVLTNVRFDQESRYLSYFAILVDQNSYTTSPTSNNVCVNYASNVSIPSGGSGSFTCDRGAMRGRYVTVRRTGGIRPDSVALCEVAVYAYVDVTKLQNLALNRPAQQSQTYSNYHASRANDGDASSCSLAMASEGSNIVAFWQVDLGNTYDITRVVLLNSQSPFESRLLTNFSVLVGNSASIEYDGSNVVCFANERPNGLNVLNRYYSFRCVASGRYLTVLRTQGGFRPDALAICEVYVSTDAPIATTRLPTTTPRVTNSPMARGCYQYEYSCKGGRCVHRDWLCDGIKDCEYGDDESDINCGYCRVDEVRCKNGRNCIALDALCDGFTNCQDGSDEEKCVYFDQSKSSETKIVLSKYKNIEGYQFCSTNWNYLKNDELCQKLGFGSSQQVSYEKATSGKYLNSNNQPSDQCDNSYVIALKCKPYECGYRSENIKDVGQYIVNGDTAKQGAWPWQIYYTIDGNFGCGGSILNANWILTAAHCVYNGGKALNTNRLTVYAGSVNGLWTSDSNKQRLYVDRVIIHPQNDNYYLRYDFALMHLSYSVYWTDTARPICLPSANNPLEEYKLCVTTGFGRLAYDKNPASVLMQGRMNLMPSKDKCVDNLLSMTSSISRYEFNQLIDYSNMICAGQTPTTYGVNICHGDSGGPLACQEKSGKWVLMGVTSHYYNSFIAPYGCLNTVFARVPSVVPWIKSYI